MKVKPSVSPSTEEGLVSRFEGKPSAKTKRLVLAELETDAVLEIVNRSYGAGTLVLASDPVLAAGVPRLSTGIFALDVSLGGGFGQNRVVELHGPPQSFKSTISLRTLALLQRQNDEARGLYVDAERTFDARHAKNLGVDLERLFVFNPDSGEQAVDGVRDMLTWSVPWLVIVDSVAAMVPSAELLASAEQQGMGQHARLVNKFMRVLVARMKRSRYTLGEQPVTVLLLNQLRMKVGVMFGNPETTPGGLGKDFACSQVVRLGVLPSKAKLAAVKLPSGETHKVQIAQVVGFKVRKNKCGGPQYESGEFTYYERPYKGHLAGSIDNAAARVYYGQLCGLVKFTPRVGYSYRGLTARKLPRFIAELTADKRLARSLELDVLELTATHGLTGHENLATKFQVDEIESETALNAE